MTVTTMVVDTTIPERLGQVAMSELAGSLFAADCQSCGKPLGAEPPSLCLDDMMVVVAAGLHHPARRRSEWTEGVHLNPTAEYLSWVSKTVLVPFRTSEADLDLRPMMLVNPGLEQVCLEQDETEGWHVVPHNQFPAAGMNPPGRQFIVDRPVPGAVARLLPDAVAVTMQNPPSQTFEAPADRGLSGPRTGRDHPRSHELRGAGPDPRRRRHGETPRLRPCPVGLGRPARYPDPGTAD